MAGFSLTSFTDRILGINRSEDVSVVAAGRTTESALMEMLDGLSNGETIVGKILSSSEDSFKIITGNNITLSAKTQGGVVLKEGTSVLFEVCKSADRQVKLRPLYQNTADANTATTALRQAMIPINERSLELVARRMEYGDSIDRNSLLEAYKDISNFEEVPVRYIVDLQKMKIPVTAINLTQYESFMNMSNSVSEALENIGNSLTLELIDSFDKDPAVFASFANDLSQVAGSLDELETMPNAVNLQELEALTTLLKEEGVITDKLDVLVSEQPERIPPEKVMSSLLMDLSDNALKLNEVKPESIFFESEDKGVVYESSAPLQGLEESEVIPTANDNTGKQITQEVLNGIINSPVLKEVISKTLVSRGLIDRDKATDKNEINRMYSRLLTETNNLLNSLSSKVAVSGETAAAIQNLQNNVDFMNALNTFVPYVQIPFNSESGNHTGELYVFKNKHSLSSGDSELTAFLHLDMANLGPTDVFVSLKDARVTTNFTLKDEETLSFIENNIHYLDERLTEKGYNFKFDAKMEKQMTPPVEKMLSNKLSKIMVAKTSFDARA